MENFPNIYKYVTEQWSWACQSLLCGVRCKPTKPPGEGLVRQVWRQNFKHVRPIRKGDFAVCVICSDLNDEQRKGFKEEQHARNWREKNRVHHKVHRACRQGSLLRAHEVVLPHP